jgi:hypothetical protein
VLHIRTNYSLDQRESALEYRATYQIALLSKPERDSTRTVCYIPDYLTIKTREKDMIRTPCYISDPLLSRPERQRETVLEQCATYQITKLCISESDSIRTPCNIADHITL